MHVLEQIRSNIEQPLNIKYGIWLSNQEWTNLINASQNFDRNNSQTDENSSQKTALGIIKRMYVPNHKEELHGFLESLSRLEPQANVFDVEVRDHVIHAVNTFLLGVYIIETTNLSDKCKDNLVFQWKVCGPTHDIGYTYELLLRAMNKQVQLFTDLTKGISIPKLHLPEIMPRNIKSLSQGFDSQHLIQQRLADWGINFNIEEYIKELRDNNMPDHGVISAFLEMKYLEALYHKNNDARLCSENQEEEFLWDYSCFNKDIISACAAVLLHNIKNKHITDKVCKHPLMFNFNKTPLAFVLYLCDNFQEWDRYGFGKETMDGNSFNISANTECISLTAPNSCSNKMKEAIESRLSGYKIVLNGNVIST